MRYILFVLFLLRGSGFLFAQQIISERKYGFVSGKSIAQGIDTTENNGYIVTLSQNYPNATFPGINFKLSGSLDTIWTSQNQNTYIVFDGNPSKFHNNSYYFSSCFARAGNNDSVFAILTKTDILGNISFRKTYIPNDRTGFAGVSRIEIINNEIILFGTSSNSKITIAQGGSYVFSIVVTDTNGVELRNKVFHTDTTIGDPGTSLVRYGANIAMYGFNGTYGLNKPFITKARLNLDTIKTKTMFWSTQNNEFVPTKGNIIYLKSNNFFFSGTFRSSLLLPYNKAGVMKSDTNLNLIWSMRVPQTGTTSSRIFELENDTLLLVSFQQGSSNIWLYKILQDSTIVSTTQLTSTIGGLGQITSAVLKRNGELAISGDAGRSTSSPYNPATAYVCVIQTNSRPIAPVVTYTESFAETLAKASILFFPNPAKETLNYESSTTGELLLQDASGKIIKDVGIREKKGTINISGLTSGSYTYRFTTRSFMESGKVMVE